MVRPKLTEQREIVAALRTDYSVRQICEVLGFTRSTLYYHPKQDPSEVVLRAEIETLALRYPIYGYRRITKLLVRMGYTVGCKRVARLMKAANLLVSVKRVCQTTTSVDSVRPWGNRLKDLEVSRCDQVWVGDITYVRLKAHFVYVCLLMDVFTRMIRGWQVSQHLTQPLTLKPLETALRQSVPEIHHSDQGVQYLSDAYVSMLRHHGIEISVVRRGCPWENGYAERLIRSRRKKFTSTTMKTSMKREIVLDILSNKCITKNAPFGVRLFDTYGIRATKLGLTLRNCAPNKRWHFNTTPKRILCSCQSIFVIK